MTSDALVPLVVVVPLVAAAVLAAPHDRLPRRVSDVAATAVAAFVTVAACLLLVATRDRPLVYWFGGWTPVKGLAVGVDLVVEPVAASLAALAGLVCTAVLVFSWRYFEEVGYLFSPLVLTFLAGMVGFTLSGDLFNVFVWLELMSVSAYALCGYQVRRPDVIQGATNFAVVNSVGTFAMLLGIALLYGRTGALNLSQIGRTLGAAPADGLVVVAFTLVAVGFLVKAGAVPFHFWLSDAYAVAPAPVGALFAGVMTDLAYHTFGRVYADAFSPVLRPHAAGVRTVLLCVAVLTAVLGAVMCLLQADLKRQVAFLSISHGGLLLAGIAVLAPVGLAGTALYTVSDGLLRAALFLLIAVVVQRAGTADELLLRGRGRGRPGVLPAVLLAACGLGLASLPPFGTFRAAGLVLDAVHPRWLLGVFAASTAAGAATVLRAGARTFLGWGAGHDPLLTSQRSDPPEPREGREMGTRLRLLLLAPAAVLVVLGCAAPLVPPVTPELLGAAHGALDARATAADVLDGTPPPAPPPATSAPSAAAWGYGAASTAGALLLAAAGLWWQRVARGVGGVVLPPVRLLKGLHSGVLGDYVLWFVTGTAVLGSVWMVLLR